MATSKDITDRIRSLEKELDIVNNRRQHILDRLAQLQRMLSEGGDEPLEVTDGKATHISQASPESEKIKLFRALFKGREVCYELLWICYGSHRTIYA